MTTGSRSGGLRSTRRGFLAAGAILPLVGCLDGSADSVSVLSAGSLARTFEEYVGPAFHDETGIEVRGEYYGTNAVMRMVEDRTKHPDVIVSADATLLRDRLYEDVTDWDVEFATNSVGIGYNDETTFGQRLEKGEPWYEVALDTDDGDLTIADPNLDPLGYRAVQAFELAEAEYGLDGFREAMLERVYREPEEPQIMAGVESGGRAGAIVYRNMAVDHDVPYRDFDDAYNFSDPERNAHYATAEFTTDEEGYTAEGRAVVYNATVNDEADEPAAGRRLVNFLAHTPDVLEAAGLTVPDGMPVSEGDLPEGLEL